MWIRCMNGYLGKPNIPTIIYQFIHVQTTTLPPHAGQGEQLCSTCGYARYALCDCPLLVSVEHSARPTALLRLQYKSLIFPLSGLQY